jgi:hypothetical protein
MIQSSKGEPMRPSKYQKHLQEYAKERDKIRGLVEAHPELTFAEIGKKFLGGMSRQSICNRIGPTGRPKNKVKPK